MDNCSLERIYNDLADKLPFNTDGNESFTFTIENLPLPPSEIATQKLYLKKSHHTYNESTRYDLLFFNAHKETYRFLGLLILSTIFHPQPSSVTVKLNHPESEISNLIIEFPHADLSNLASGYYTKPFAFNYYPVICWKHPFDKCIDPDDLPRFSLTNLDGLAYTDDEWDQRDTVRLFGTGRGMIAFAELLLNAALPQSQEDEYQLEGEGGFRGVGIQSAEVTLLLPGHVFWYDEHWQ